MKTSITIQHSETSKTGYEMVDNGKVIQLDSTYPGEPNCLVLPTNSANRKYLMIKKIIENGGKLELDYKETKHFGPRDSSNPRQPSKPLEDYLEGEERETFIKLLEKSKKIRQEMTKPVPLTDLERAKRNAERAQEKLDKLLKEQEMKRKVEEKKIQKEQN